MKHADFLRDITDRPDDEAPRLVYADWLGERGDPRGEFILIQCQRSRLSMDDPHRVELEHREEELLDAHRDEWRAALELPDGKEAIFRRGFVEMLELDVEDVRERADLATLTPLRHLAVKIHARVGRSLAAAPLLARLEALELQPKGKGNVGKALADVLASPQLGGLRRLYVRASRLDDDGAAVVAKSPVARQLHTLDLGSNALGVGGAHALAEGPFDRLEALALDTNQLGAAGLAALATGAFPALRSLGVGVNGLDDEALANLAAAPWLRRLELLSVGNTDLSLLPYRIHDLQSVSDRDFVTVAELWTVLSFDELVDERADTFSAAGVTSLLAHPLPALRTLDLSLTPVDADGARAIALAAPRLPGLDWLGLRGCKLGDGIAALGDALHEFPRLAFLDACDDDTGLAALPLMMRLPQVSTWVRTLAASYGAITDDTHVEIVRAALPRLPRLRRVDLAGNPALGEDDSRRLKSLLPALPAQLRELFLTGCAIDDATQETLTAKFGKRVSFG